MLPKIVTKEKLPGANNSSTKRSYNEHSLQNPWFEDVEHLPKPDPVYLDDLQIKETKHQETFNSLLGAKPDPSNDDHRPLDRQGKVQFAPSRPRRYTRRPYVKGKYILRKIDDVDLPLPRPTNMNVLLWHSAANGNRSGCRDAMINGASPKWRNETYSDDKYTPFLIAVRNGHMNCVRFFCEECLHFDLEQASSKGRDGFLEACLHGRLDVIKYLCKNYKHDIKIRKKDRNGNTALTLSNKCKNKKVKKLVIKLLRDDHKRTKRLLGHAGKSKYQRNLAIAYTLYS